jgi:hypothetical protein
MFSYKCERSRNRLHKHIAIDVLTQVPFSNNLNFGNTTPKLRDTKAKAKAQILGRGCVATRM